jgi:hypothetical protein
MKIQLMMLPAMMALASVPAASAMPRSALVVPMTAEQVRTVCDQWGRCWNQPDYGYRRSYGDGYGYGYDDPYRRRPPTKWERKGFCPPGQAKKGNC